MSSGPLLLSLPKQKKERVKSPRLWAGVVCDFSGPVCIVGREGCVGRWKDGSVGCVWKTGEMDREAEVWQDGYLEAWWDVWSNGRLGEG